MNDGDPDKAKVKSIFGRWVDIAKNLRAKKPGPSKPEHKAVAAKKPQPVPPTQPKIPEPSSLDHGREDRDHGPKRPVKDAQPPKIYTRSELVGFNYEKERPSAIFDLGIDREEIKALQEIENRFPEGKPREEALQIHDDTKLAHALNVQKRQESYERARLLIKGLDVSKLIPESLSQDMNAQMRDADALYDKNKKEIEDRKERCLANIKIDLTPLPPRPPETAPEPDTTQPVQEPKEGVDSDPLQADPPGPSNAIKSPKVYTKREPLGLNFLKEHPTQIIGPGSADIVMKKAQQVDERFPRGQPRNEAQEIHEDALFAHEKNEREMNEQFGKAYALIADLDGSQPIPDHIDLDMKAMMREAYAVARNKALEIEQRVERCLSQIVVELPEIVRPSVEVQDTDKTSFDTLGPASDPMAKFRLAAEALPPKPDGPIDPPSM